MLISMRSLLITLLLASTALADVRLPALISDHMVLQSATPVRIWGWATPGEAISISFNGQQSSTQTQPDGRWEAYLKPLAPGGPFELTVTGQNTIKIQDVLIGEVWIASGQSNMAFQTKRAKGADQIMAAAANPNIRLFTVARKLSSVPEDDVKGTWQIASSESAGNFSAVAYLFAKELEGQNKMPFGMINSSVGGTPVEAWISGQTLSSDPALLPVLTRWQKILHDYPAAARRHALAVKKWQDEGKKGAQPAAPVGPGHWHEPIQLFNGMIAPVTPYAIRGALWYQGENNAGKNDGDLYRRLLETLIHDWRQQWGTGNFPFLWVQLPHFIMKGNESGWPEVQEAMRNTLEIANTGMAISQDAGEANDIHPTDKLPVAKRLALTARKVAYGENILASGPIFRQATREANVLRLWFDHAGDGMRTNNNAAVEGMLIAGRNGKYVTADVKIDGATLLVSSSEVPHPLSVRYAWGGTVVGNLANSIQIPASPFRATLP